jgi:hypothetical protein
MAEGPGRYDDVTTLVRKETQAETCIVIIINGNKGNGFSIQSIDPDFRKHLPKVLRLMMEEMEAEDNFQ